MKLKVKLACLICIFAIPVILSSCKESLDIEEVATTPNLSQGLKPSAKEIEEFKNWYSNLETTSNARIGANDEIDEIQEIELWNRAISHKQEKASNKLITLPLIDFKEKGKTKVKQLYLAEIDGKKSGYKVEIKSNNGKSAKFTGTVTIMSLDEKSKREYTYKDNKLESKKNSRLADFGNVDLPEVTVTASVQHNGTWYFVSVLFSPANTSPFILNATVEPCEWGCASDIDLEHNPILVLELILWVREKLAQEGLGLNQAEINILKTMSTTDIMRFAENCFSAKRWANNYFNGQGGVDGGHPNAFKHVALATLHVRDFGYNIAQQLVNAHEFGESGCNTIMDAANNQIGLNLGTNVSLYDIYLMAKAGQLWTLGGNNCINKVPF